MEDNFIWIPRQLHANDSDPELQVGSSFDVSDQNMSLAFGGLDFSLLSSENYRFPGEFGICELIEVVVDHLIHGRYDLFCVQDISTAVLEAITEIIRANDSSWDFGMFTDDTNNPTWVNHVIFYKKSLLQIVDMTISFVTDRLYEEIKTSNLYFKEERMIKKETEDSFGFIILFKMKELDVYIKVLSINLPPLRHEEITDERGELLRNISLKTALHTLTWDSKLPDSQCFYFVYGSLCVTEGSLLKSSIHRMLTEGKFQMVLPKELIDDIERPICRTIEVVKLYHYDPESLIPVKPRGTTGFVYHSKLAIPHFLYKKQIRDIASCSKFRKFYDTPCGGRFLLSNNFGNILLVSR